VVELVKQAIGGRLFVKQLRVVVVVVFHGEQVGVVLGEVELVDGCGEVVVEVVEVGALL